MNNSFVCYEIKRFWQNEHHLGLYQDNAFDKTIMKPILNFIYWYVIMFTSHLNKMLYKYTYNIPILLDKILFFAIACAVDLCLNNNAAQWIYEQSETTIHQQWETTTTNGLRTVEIAHILKHLTYEERLQNLNLTSLEVRQPYPTTQNRCQAKLLQFPFCWLGNPCACVGCSSINY